jgi:hypothetical protein
MFNLKKLFLQKEKKQPVYNTRIVELYDMTIRVDFIDPLSNFCENTYRTPNGGMFFETISQAYIEDCPFMDKCQDGKIDIRFEPDHDCDISISVLISEIRVFAQKDANVKDIKVSKTKVKISVTECNDRVVSWKRI